MGRLNHLTLFVNDRKIAADWYVQMMGLEVEFELPDARATAVRDPADFTIFLTERPGVREDPPCILYFQVDDVDAEFERISSGKGAVTHPPRVESWGYGPELVDPDGHAIRLWDHRSIK